MRDIELGYWYTRVVENAKTCDFSIVDFLASNPQPEIADAVVCSFNSVFEEDYVDPYWTYNIGSQLLSFSTTAGSWYGSQNYVD